MYIFHVVLNICYLLFLVDGGYGQWSSYGSCTKTCGSGEQSRSRACDTPTPQNGGKDCTLLGEATETKSCNTNPCPGRLN